MITTSVDLNLSAAPQLRGRPTLKPTEFENRFWTKVDRTAGEAECWPWTAARLPNGYGAQWRQGRAHKAHRVAWTLAVGRIPRGKLVLHKCDNPPCVNPAHLYVGTHRDNTRDMIERGRHNRDGRRHLTPWQVLDIRWRYAAGGVTFKTLADEYGVTEPCIHSVVHRKTWRNLPDVAGVAA